MTADSTDRAFTPEQLAELTKALMDQGKLVEAGFASLRHVVMDQDAPDIQVREMRMAFFAGAQHTFGSIMTGLDPGSEPTPADEARMELLAAELARFGREFTADLPGRQTPPSQAPTPPHQVDASEEKIRLGVASSRAKSKARDQLRALLRDTSLTSTLALGRTETGEWTMLAGGMSAREVAGAIMVATQGVERMLEHERNTGGGASIRLDASIPVEPSMVGRGLGRRRKPEIRHGDDGEMEAPKGEAFSYCAECGSSRWYATTKDDGSQGRLACCRCGNEIATIRVDAEGHA